MPTLELHDGDSGFSCEGERGGSGPRQARARARPAKPPPFGKEATAHDSMFDYGMWL